MSDVVPCQIGLESILIRPPQHKQHYTFTISNYKNTFCFTFELQTNSMLLNCWLFRGFAVYISLIIMFIMYDKHMYYINHCYFFFFLQEKYNRTEPRNHRCKVCHSWFGLFATFVKHMETESHSYQCRECGLLFVQPGPRRNHIQSIHPEIANICEVKCSKNFFMYD